MADVLFRKIDGGYLATFVVHELEFAADRLRWDHDELYGQLSVAWPDRRPHFRRLRLGRDVQLLQHARPPRASERSRREQMAERVAEVRHLSRLPKPVIVRPNGSGYVIVDGEHGWRAAQTVGLAEVLCEVVRSR